MPFWTAYTLFNYFFVNWRRGREEEDFPQARKSSPTEKLSGSPCLYLPQGEGTNRAQAGLSSRTSARPLAAYLCLLVAFVYPPHTRSRQLWGVGLQAPPRSPSIRSRALSGFWTRCREQLAYHIGFAVRSHWWCEKTARDRVFSVPVWGKGRRKKHWFKALPAFSGTVPSCCKVGWWSSEMNPTDILKQIGLVGVASKMNNSPNPPWKEKQRATSLQGPSFAYRNQHLSEGWTAFRLVA